MIQCGTSPRTADKCQPQTDTLPKGVIPKSPRFHQRGQGSRVYVHSSQATHARSLTRLEKTPSFGMTQYMTVEGHGFIRAVSQGSYQGTALAVP
jgi:hypothetical protein